MEKYLLQAMLAKGRHLVLLCLWLSFLCINKAFSQPVTYTQITDAFLAKDYSLCVHLSNLYLSNNPGDTNVLFIRAKSKYHQEFYSSAISDLDIVYKLVNEKHPILYFKGLCLLNLQDYIPARKAFIEAISLHENNAAYHYNLGLLYILTNNWNAAIECFSKVISLEPTNANAYSNRGFAYSMKHNYEASLKDYNIAIQKNPLHEDLLVKRGMVLISLRKNQQAINTLKQALAINPQNHHAYYNLGRAYFESKDFYKAKQYFDTAIAIKPDMEIALFNRGVTLLELSKSNTNIACTDFKKAATLGYGEAWEYLKKYCK